MSKSAGFLVICAVLVTLSTPAVDAAASGDHHHLGWFPIAGTTTPAAECRGSMAECLAAGGEVDLEFEMDSEINRRILQTTQRYISYGALSRNSVPCSRRGASYYNCRPGAQANPYTRGCSAITRCRS